MTYRASLVTSLLLVLLPLVSWSQEPTGRVVRVVDGDTLVLLDGDHVQHRIRLAGIDCPERKQPWNARAKEFLSDHVFDHTVTVDWTKRDRYKRILGKVVRDGRDVNLALVADGLCWWYRKYAGEQTAVDRVLYEDAEEEARSARRGVWSDPKPVPPWEGGGDDGGDATRCRRSLDRLQRPVWTRSGLSQAPPACDPKQTPAFGQLT